MRDAEIKHSRLAMLAAAGWPLSELWHKEIANIIGLDSILASADKAPSVLNGGLANFWIIGTGVLSLVMGALLEFSTLEAVSFCVFTDSILFYYYLSFLYYSVEEGWIRTRYNI
jgi:light-harvesting complex II chlorophyll a/b binding protein 4